MTHRYTSTAIAVHWLMAILIFGLLALGTYMQDLPLSPDKLKLYSWHKWAGVTVFLLLLFRLTWRAGHPPPPLPDSMPKPLQLAAHAGHLALYGLMLVIPISGWLMSSAKGFQTVWFGVLPIPDLLEKNKEVGDLLQTVHMSLNLLFAAVIVGHVGAALKHHFIDKDDILTRMLPRQSKEN
ncbi:MAG: cytochrome b [Betaproteobacteria bacterium HGW-Betaproteobacteria-12]|nr:MAG: cytochrome b [Betaproteobacteria bacterium HGW-Betaproteobacteria-12]